jgi:hypothetical protein
MKYYFRGFAIFAAGYADAWVDSHRGPHREWYFAVSLINLVVFPLIGMIKGGR